MTPVLFVHGSGLSSGSFETMIAAFTDRGYPPEYLSAVDMVPNDGDNVRAAETFIAEGVEQLLASSKSAATKSGCSEIPPEKVDMVAHSMGAFSSRWFARFVGPERVRTIVTLAGANHGTNKLCGRSGTGDRQMCPAFSDQTGGDDVQHRLNGTSSMPLDETPFGVGADPQPAGRIPPDDRRSISYFTVRLEPDAWIEPADSAMLDGAGGATAQATDGFPLEETSNGNFLFRGQTSHDDLPYHPALIRFVLQILQ